VPKRATNLVAAEEALVRRNVPQGSRERSEPPSLSRVVSGEGPARSARVRGPSPSGPGPARHAPQVEHAILPEPEDVFKAIQAIEAF
jgi:hypothetical protein